MTMENDTGNDYKTAEELARFMEKMPVHLESLKLDRPTLVTRLGALMHDISTFSRCTFELVERGDLELAREGVDAFSEKFARVLEMSEDDGLMFCMFLLMMTMMFRKMGPFIDSIVEKNWEKWFRGVWGKEG